MFSRSYIAIDLKSFYASAECADRKLDPLTTNLVVADQSRTDKTICLAVSPALKACGIPGRPRLFEVVQKVRQVNAQRQRLAPEHRSAPELAANPSLKLDYIVAVPRMARYIEVSKGKWLFTIPEVPEQVVVPWILSQRGEAVPIVPPEIVAAVRDAATAILGKLTP